MSLSTLFYEPISISNFSRLFDEAFDQKTEGNSSGNNSQLQRHSRFVTPR